MSKRLEVLTTVETIKRCTIKITGNDILAWMGKQVPKNARNLKVTFNVPTGGDYIGEGVVICPEDPIWVTWEEHTVEDHRD